MLMRKLSLTPTRELDHGSFGVKGGTDPSTRDPGSTSAVRSLEAPSPAQTFRGSDYIAYVFVEGSEDHTVEHWVLLPGWRSPAPGTGEFLHIEPVALAVCAPKLQDKDPLEITGTDFLTQVQEALGARQIEAGYLRVEVPAMKRLSEVAGRAPSSTSSVRRMRELY